MKKIYTLLLLSSTIAFAQTPIITGVMDGDCNGGNPKALEIYANGTVNFADYSLENQTNANTGTWAATLSLADLGTVTNSFVYVILGGTPSASGTDPVPIPNIARFSSEFPTILLTSIFSPPVGTPETPCAACPQPLNVNGDDRIRIINTETLAVIDQYGISDTDGTGTGWEYLDSWAKRNNGTGPDGSTFVAANWTYGGVAALDTLGACQGGATYSTIVPFGQFTLGVNENDITGLKVYPNPVSNGTLYIDTNANAEKTVVIFDVLGKQVVNTTTSTNAVNVSNLKGGVYIVKITEEGKTATRKLVIR